MNKRDDIKGYKKKLLKCLVGKQKINPKFDLRYFNIGWHGN